MNIQEFLDILVSINKAFRQLQGWAIQLSLAVVTLAIFYISRRFTRKLGNTVPTGLIIS